MFDFPSMRPKNMTAEPSAASEYVLRHVERFASERDRKILDATGILNHQAAYDKLSEYYGRLKEREEIFDGTEISENWDHEQIQEVKTLAGLAISDARSIYIRDNGPLPAY